MGYCSNPDCPKPSNPDGQLYCQGCGNLLTLLKNRYESLRPLGKGGFGQTYLAEDKDGLNQKCVIKQFCPNVQGSQAMAIAKSLFEREAQQLQKLGDHSQIPKLYAYFEQDNQLYLIQQYISGVTLEQELKEKGIFSEEKVMEVLRETLTILDFVHSQKVIHRDIKPSNIMRFDQDNGILKADSLVLIDFGIAKQATHTLMSVNGTIVGSLGYAALEQMDTEGSNPSGGNANPTSDLYGLGATCFHLLTGISPSKLCTLKGYSWTTNWQDHLTNAVTPTLERVLTKLLQIEVKDRYQTARLALDDLSANGIVSQPLFPPVPASSLPTVVVDPSTIVSASNTRIVDPNTMVVDLNNSIPSNSSQLNPTQILGSPDPSKNISIGLFNAFFQLLQRPFIGFIVGGLSLGLLGLASPKLPLICNALHNCSSNQDFQTLYEQSTKDADQSIKRANSSSSIAVLEESHSTINRSIGDLETIPKDASVSDQALKAIDKYNQELTRINNLIENLNTLPTPVPSIKPSNAPSIPSQQPISPPATAPKEGVIQPSQPKIPRRPKRLKKTNPAPPLWEKADEPLW